MSERSSQHWTTFELDCLRELEQQKSSSEDGNSSPPSTPSVEPTNSSLWDNFELCAHSIAKLYKNPQWHSFQQSAAATTQLYKESVEAQRRSVDYGMNLGRQRSNKELIGFLKSLHHSKSLVRREELLAFLAGKSPPPPPTMRHGSAVSSPVVRTMDQLRLQSPSHISTRREDSTDSPSAINMFHEALTLQHGGSSPVRSSSSSRCPELSNFLLEELRRHRKRRRDGDGSPSREVLFSHKRQRRL